MGQRICNKPGKGRLISFSLKAKIEKRKLSKNAREKFHVQTEVSKHADEGDNQANEKMGLYPVEEAGEIKEG